MTIPIRAVPFCALFALAAPAADFTAGVQAALVTPASADLRLTAGKVQAAVGLHGTWPVGGGFRVRPRVDYTGSATQSQEAAGATSQTITTRVSSLALGADGLFCLPGQDRWAVGLSLAEVRWAVRGTQSLRLPGGTVAAEGTSHWWRGAVGLVGLYRLGPRLEAEVRLVSSRYGQENQSADTVSCGLLWQF